MRRLLVDDDDDDGYKIAYSVCPLEQMRQDLGAPF